MRLISAVYLGLFALSAQAGEPAYTVRATDLKAKPFADSRTLGYLPEHSRVEVLKHQTSWIQIRSDSASGWVKMLSLRFESGAAKNASAAGGLKALFNVATTGSSGHTVTTGVRGLSEENLKNAHPDPDALKLLQSYAASSKGAASFAKAGKLREQPVDYFPAAAGEK